MILKKKQDTKAFDPKKYQVGSLTEGDILNIKKVYDSLDTGHKGYLEPKDIAQALHREGFNASRETVYDIVAEYDQLEEGGLKFSDFVRIMEDSPAARQTQHASKQMFRRYDRANKGYITKEDIRAMAQQLHEELSEEILQTIMQRGDRSGKGRISPDAFYQLMTKQLHFR